MRTVDTALQHHESSHRQLLLLEEVTAMVAGYGLSKLLGRYCLVCRVLLFMHLESFLCIVS